MFRKVSITIVLLVLFSVSALIAAQEGYNPEPFTPEDNACYEGGSMWRDPSESDGCTTDWHWECGWYVARYEADVYTEDDIPAWCDSLINMGALSDDVINALDNASCSYQIVRNERERVATTRVNIAVSWGTPLANQAKVIYTIQSTDFEEPISSGVSSNSETFSYSGFVNNVSARVTDALNNTLLSVPCTNNTPVES